MEHGFNGIKIPPVPRMNIVHTVALDLAKTRPDLSLPAIAKICFVPLCRVRTLAKEAGLPPRKRGRKKIR